MEETPSQTIPSSPSFPRGQVVFFFVDTEFYLISRGVPLRVLASHIRESYTRILQSKFRIYLSVL